MIRNISAIGIGIVDVRAETTGSDGVLLPRYASSRDGVHANNAFGEAVFDRFFEILSREAQAPRLAGRIAARPPDATGAPHFASACIPPHR